MFVFFFIHYSSAFFFYFFFSSALWTSWKPLISQNNVHLSDRGISGVSSPKGLKVHRVLPWNFSEGFEHFNIKVKSEKWFFNSILFEWKYNWLEKRCNLIPSNSVNYCVPFCKIKNFWKMKKRSRFTSHEKRFFYVEIIFIFITASNEVECLVVASI